MSVSRKENGSLVKKAGKVLVDLALSLTSNHAISNSAASAAIAARNVCLYNGKLYEINLDGTRGAEIKMGLLVPKYVIDNQGYNSARGGGCNYAIADNVNKVMTHVAGDITESNIDISYVRIVQHSVYNVTFQMVKEAYWYPDKSPVPIVLPVGATVQIGYASTSSAVNASAGTLCWID